MRKIILAAFSIFCFVTFSQSSYEKIEINGVMKIKTSKMIGRNCFDNDIIQNDSSESSKQSTYFKVESDSFFVYLSVINGLKSDIIIKTQDGCIPMIREALDSSGNWLPIEAWMLSDCGNSYDHAILPSRSKFFYRINHYSGDFHTKIRFKIKYNDSIIVTDSYYDYINIKQFIKPTKEDEPYANFLE